MRMASACWPLRNEVLPVSRSLLTCALRFGLTGTGGGGMPFGESTLRRERCRALSLASSSLRADEGVVVEDMALLVGSRWRGSRVKVSSSMVSRLILGQVEVLGGERFFLRGLIAWVYVAGAANVVWNSSKRTPRMEIDVQMYLLQNE